MIRSLLIITLLMFIFPSCTQDMKGDIESWKNEIVDTEYAFAEMVKREGISKAFVTFASDDAVLLRNNKLIKGKDALKANFEKQVSSGNVSLTWAPDFVDVSTSGDLGYTYGKYVFTATDSLGNTQTNEGVFHTVWKRQSEGKWKFVWD